MGAMGAEYLSYVKSIATFAPTFYGYIISFLASVRTPPSLKFHNRTDINMQAMLYHRL